MSHRHPLDRLLSADGMKGWDSLGLLHFAVASETAEIANMEDDD